MKKILLLLSSLLLGASFAEAADPANQKILKDAVVGAVTGAVATEATKDESKLAPTAAPTPAAASSEENEEHHGHHHKHKKHKHHGEGKRPHGWDQGKKKGWGDSDLPPGLAKKSAD